MRTFFAHRNQRGDTIVEVLLAIGIIGAVLGGSAVVINKNIRTNQAIQEREQAIRLAERQLELYKAGAQTKTFVDDTPTNFCMLLDGGVPKAVTYDNDTCTLDASGATTTVIPNYKVAITAGTPANTTALLPSTVAGKSLTIKLTWDSALGGNQEQLLTYAEVYSRGQ